jgi:SAM-dependent methyltransferase
MQYACAGDSPMPTQARSRGEDLFQLARHRLSNPLYSGPVDTRAPVAPAPSRPSCRSRTRRARQARFSLGNAQGAAAVFLLLSAACSDWRGLGFRASGPELPRLRHVLALEPGMSVADVGAGRGEMTVALAAEVGPSGRVYASDIDPASLEDIRARVAAAGVRNVTILQARARDTGLPPGCCNAVVLRRVYHHLSDPVATNVDLLRAVRPGGVLAIIDFPPMLSWLWPWPPNDPAGNRTGHGVAARLVVEEVTASGFTFVKVIEDWPGRGPLKSFCAIFRKAEAGP